MTPSRHLLTALSLMLMLVGVWTGPVSAQSVATPPEAVVVVQTEVPQAVVPERAPVVPAPTAPVRIVPEGLDRTEDGISPTTAAVSRGRTFAPVRWTAFAPPSGRTLLYDVLMVYRI